MRIAGGNLADSITFQTDSYVGSAAIPLPSLRTVEDAGPYSDTLSPGEGLRDVVGAAPYAIYGKDIKKRSVRNERSVFHYITLQEVSNLRRSCHHR